MSAPYLKLYQLPEGYDQAQDNDVQTITNDELLPLVDRSQLLINAVTLTGIVPIDDVDLQPLNIGIGRANYDLVDPSALIQTTVGLDIADIINAVGAIGINVFDGDDRLMTGEQWTLEPDGFHFQPGVAPSGGYVSCYVVGTTPTDYWALAGDTLYAGANGCFNQLLVRIDGGPLQAATASGGQLTLGSPASTVVARYAYVDTYSKWFIAEQPNWVTGHMNTNPDVFVGTYDYPGDTSLINGVPVDPGLQPLFVDPSTYSLDARRGMVAFPQSIDSTVTPVAALYAYLGGIGNVTSQRLQAVDPSGLVYQAVDETAFPGSHNEPWVLRNSINMPVNIYVAGVLTPTVTPVTPYDTLTVVMA